MSRKRSKKIIYVVIIKIKIMKKLQIPLD